MLPDSDGPQQERLTVFQLVLLVLAIYVLAALAVEVMFPLSEATTEILDWIDTAVCIVFLVDFVVRFHQAPRKLAFLKWGWIDLVSSIPTIQPLRWGRMVRVVRVLRLLRGMRSAKDLAAFIFRNRAVGVFGSMATISFLLVVFSSIAILDLERGPDAVIRTPSDALWWSIVTISTVGYGDLYPVTPEGRILAGLLMGAGIGLFGTFTAYVASLVLPGKDDGTTIEEVLAEVRRLHERITELEGHNGSER